MSAVFQNKAIPVSFINNVFRKIVQYVTVWLVWIWTYKNADLNSFSWGECTKTEKADKNRILCKSTLNKYANFEKYLTRLQGIAMDSCQNSLIHYRLLINKKIKHYS